MTFKIDRDIPPPDSGAPNDRLLKATEAAEILGVSQASFYRIAKRHHIPTIRPLPNTARFRASDVQAFIAQGADHAE